MQTIIGVFLALQHSAWWSGAGIVAIALLICCLVMMFMMGRGMGRKDKNDSGRTAKLSRNEGERPRT